MEIGAGTSKNHVDYKYRWCIIGRLHTISELIVFIKIPIKLKCW